MKLLVMEDEIRLADILSDWFQKKGFEVTVCHDGLSGYEKAQNENFDVILSDVMLPGLEGFQLVRKLREKKIATPVLFLTALIKFLPRNRKKRPKANTAFRRCETRLTLIALGNF